jgi:hypothetical protein
LKEFWKIIDGEMSIPKGYHPYFGEQTKLDSSIPYDDIKS